MNVFRCTNFLYGDFKGFKIQAAVDGAQTVVALITECRQMYVGRGSLSRMSKDFFGQI